MQAHQSTNSQPTCAPLQPQPLSTIDADCKTHGPYTARVLMAELGVSGKPVVTRCPTCTAEWVAEEAARDARNAERARKGRVMSLLDGSGIPRRFQDRDFAAYVATEQGQRIALGVCRAYADAWPVKLDAGASLVLTGGPGTGKTHLACATAQHVIRHHLAHAVFGSVSSMLRSIKSTYAKDSTRSEQSAIDALVDPDLLVLDEVGVQVGSEHEKMLMFEVLNTRYQELRPTILISNLDAADLDDFLGQRVMDRYRECGSVLAFDWQSYRGRK